MTVAIRFVHGGGTTDFYDDEIEQIDIITVQEIDLYKDISGYYNFNKVGESYKRIKVVFSPEIVTLFTRLDEIYARVDSNYDPEVMTCYYRYAIDTTTYSIDVQMDRGTMQWNYFNGEQPKDLVEIYFSEAVAQNESDILIENNLIIGS